MGKNSFVHFHEKVARNTQQIKYVEDKLISNPNSLRLHLWLTWLLQQREKMMLFDQKYWGQVRQKEWLVNGDRNTTFFQRRVNTRRKKKLIIKLCDDDGIWINEQHAIRENIG